MGPLCKVVKRHRVEGLVHHGLSQAGIAPPEPVAHDLAAEASRIVRQNLAFAAESLRLLRRLEAAGIPLLFVKGVTLSALAYGTLSLKMGWDIDVLVPPEDVACAADLLQQAEDPSPHASQSWLGARLSQGSD